MTNGNYRHRREFVKLAIGSVAIAVTVRPQNILAGGHLQKLDESDPQALALAYKHDATQVDAATQAKYEPGQLCKNCTLYKGDSEKEWGECAIFPGKEVNANGWCSGYVAVPS